MAVDPLITAALIGAGSNLLGGSLGIFGGGSDTARNDARFMNDFAWKQALRMEEFQKDLAYHGIQRRVRDAENAQIHPLAAMGINPIGGNPVGVNFGQTPDRYNDRWERAGDMVKNLGQDVSRAVSAQATKEEKVFQAAKLATEISQRRALDAEADLKIEQANDLRRNPSQPVDPDLPFNPVAKMKKSIGHVRDGIIGPQSRPFWKAVGRGIRRSIRPWRGEQ